MKAYLKKVLQSTLVISLALIVEIIIASILGVVLRSFGISESTSIYIAFATLAVMIILSFLFLPIPLLNSRQGKTISSWWQQIKQFVLSRKAVTVFFIAMNIIFIYVLIMDILLFSSNYKFKVNNASLQMIFESLPVFGGLLLTFLIFMLDKIIINFVYDEHLLRRNDIYSSDILRRILNSRNWIIALMVSLFVLLISVFQKIEANNHISLAASLTDIFSVVLLMISSLIFLVQFLTPRHFRRNSVLWFFLIILTVSCYVLSLVFIYL